jgi:hypothetical protein
MPLQDRAAIRNRLFSGTVKGGTVNGNGKETGRKIAALPKKNATAVAQTRAPLRALPVADENARPQVFVPPPAATTRTSDVACVSEAAQVRRLSSRPSLIPVSARQQEREREKEAAEDEYVDLDADSDVEQDEKPLAKRPRTSSVGPEDVRMRTSSVPPEDMEETEVVGTLCAYDDEVDGEWEDLDAADIDDPLMAAEYVADIQRYLRQAEVRVSSLFPLFSHSFISSLILM